MTYDEALKALKSALTAAQKDRSTLSASIGDDALGETLGANLSPWLFGPKSVVPKLAETITRAERTGSIAGSDLYNLLWIANKADLDMTASMLGGELPELDISWHGQTFVR